LLKTQDPSAATVEVAASIFPNGQTNVSGAGLQPIPAAEFNISNPSIGMVEGANGERWGFNGDSSPRPPIDHLSFTGDLNMGMSIDDGGFAWEMIGLGLEEPLPPQETIDDLWVTSTMSPPGFPLVQKLIISFSDIIFTSTKSILPFQ